MITINNTTIDINNKDLYESNVIYQLSYNFMGSLVTLIHEAYNMTVETNLHILIDNILYNPNINSVLKNIFTRKEAFKCEILYRCDKSFEQNDNIKATLLNNKYAFIEVQYKNIDSYININDLHYHYKLSLNTIERLSAKAIIQLIKKLYPELDFSAFKNKSYKPVTCNVYQYDKAGDFIVKYKTLENIVQLYPLIKYSDIAALCKGYNAYIIAEGYLWSNCRIANKQVRKIFNIQNN